MSTAHASTPTHWSSYQEAIFAEFESGTRNVVVRARAGTGKTTTIVEALRFLPAGRRTMLVAFNKSVQQELERRCPRGVEVKTLHGAGFALLRRAYGSVRVDENKTKRFVEQELLGRGLVERDGRGKLAPIGVARTAKLVGLAKATLVDDLDGLVDLALEHRIEASERYPHLQMAEVVLSVLAACRAETTVIDFDDMVWLPVVAGLRPQTHDVVVVDEAQDMNAAQIALVRSIVRPKGRIIAVGDDRQAIYGFRGAGRGSMEGLVAGTDAVVLPLSITYRCPRRVVELVRSIVPDYQAAPEAPEGLVAPVKYESPAFDPQVGDFVISRSNAPLVRVALGLLSRGRPATIAGRDVAKMLVRTLEQSRTDDIAQMLAWLRERTQAEVERFEAMDRPKRAQEALDVEETIQALAEGESTVAGIVAKTERIFTDGDQRSRIVCTSTHRAKGLERDRVWMLAETFSDRDEEERNLFYVAATRAKSELRMVSGVVG